MAHDIAPLSVVALVPTVTCSHSAALDRCAKEPIAKNLRYYSSLISTRIADL